MADIILAQLTQVFSKMSRRVGANILWTIVEEVRDPYGIDPHQPGPVTGFAGIFATDAFDRTAYVQTA